MPFELKGGLLLEALPDTSGNATGNMSATLTGIAVQGDTSFTASGASGTIYPVPEPSTVLLLLAGIAGFAAMRRSTA